MMKLKIVMVILIALIVQNSRCQTSSYYIKITDSSLVPVKDSKTTGYSSANSKVSSILTSYGVTHFEKAFPTAKSEYLQDVYLVRCLKDGLGKELQENFESAIPLVEEIEDVPQLLFEPDDYGLAISQTNLDLIKAKDAYEIVKDIPKITVALTDTYFDIDHEDLDFAGVQGTNDPTVAYAYHGTMTSGCISAITNNGVGIASVGYNSQLYASTNWANDNEILLLAQAGYRVINCSWHNSCSYISTRAALYEEIKDIWGAVVVASAGNTDAPEQCYSLSAKVYPASYPAVVSVSSVGHVHDYGSGDTVNIKDIHEQIVGDPTSTNHHNSAVDIVAPGYKVAVTDIMGTGGYYTGNYGVAWGTSVAAPQVAGTFGLVFSINPCLTADEAIDIVLSTADDELYSYPENSSYIGLLGEGRLDVTAAVRAAVETATTYFSGSYSSGATVESIFNVESDGSTILYSGADVTLNANNEVIFNEGFEVKLGAELNAYTDVGITCP